MEEDKGMEKDQGIDAEEGRISLAGLEWPDLQELRIGQARRAYFEGLRQSAKDEEEARRQTNLRQAP